MARIRIAPVVAVFVAGSFLAACSGTSSGFDPTEWLNADFLSTKTPLPGTRKPVFPEGVPGVTQGVPKELVKGSPQQQQQQQAAFEVTDPAQAEPAPEAKPETKPEAKPASKPAAKPQATRPAQPRTASAPPPARAAAPQQQPQQPQPRPAANQPSVEWPDGGTAQPPEQQRPASKAPSEGSANWPPPDSSTFSR